jgi:type IV secretory pathway VirB10-like protein
MKHTRTQVILSLVVLAVTAVFVGCGTTPLKTSEPSSKIEPVQPVITEPKVAPKPESAPKPEPPPPPPTPKAKVPEGPYFMHTVKWRGESLSTVAAWYTGTVQNWRALAEVNPQLADPNRIAVGVKIRIPEKMLRTREVMPQGFAESYAKPPKQSGAEAAGKNGEPKR